MQVQKSQRYSSRIFFFFLKCRLERTLDQLEKRNMALLYEMKHLGMEKSEKIGVFKKAETEMKFLRNELQIKEKSLQLSLIERNELLNRY